MKFWYGLIALMIAGWLIAGHFGALLALLAVSILLNILLCLFLMRADKIMGEMMREIKRLKGVT